MFLYFFPLLSGRLVPHVQTRCLHPADIQRHGEREEWRQHWEDAPFLWCCCHLLWSIRWVYGMFLLPSRLILLPFPWLVCSRRTHESLNRTLLPLRGAENILFRLASGRDMYPIGFASSIFTATLICFLSSLPLRASATRLAHRSNKRVIAAR